MGCERLGGGTNAACPWSTWRKRQPERCWKYASHTAANDVPPNYTLLEITVPQSVSVETADVNSLSRDWRQNLDETRAIGSEWLRSMRSALLRVPSAIVPATYNVLLNPRHPDPGKLKSPACGNPIDTRLKR